MPVGDVNLDGRYPVVGAAFSAAIGALNADAIPDLAVGSGSGTTLLRGNGGGTFSGAVDYSAGGYGHSIAIAGVNRDGRTDLALAVLRRVSILKAVHP